MSTEIDSEENLVELLSLRKKCSSLGTIRYYNSEKQLHRVYGPAIIWRDGTQEWWQHGHLHRDGYPAVIYADGSREWWICGKRIKQEYKFQDTVV